MAETRTLSERFRFTATEVNALNEKAMADQKELGLVVEKKTLTLAATGVTHVHYHHLIKTYIEDGREVCKNILLFEVTKDAENKFNQPSLAFMGQVIKHICAKSDLDQRNLTVLLPIMECRGYFKLPVEMLGINKWVQKRHIILAEVNFAKMEITFHDPQSDFNFFLQKLAALLKLEIYPDKVFDELLAQLHETGYNFRYQKKFYEHQNDNVTCGPFSHRYVLSYLENGNASGFNKIIVKLGNKPEGERDNPDITYMGTTDKIDYIRRYLPQWAQREAQAPCIDVWTVDTFDDLLRDRDEAYAQIPADSTRDLNEDTFVNLGTVGFFSAGSDSLCQPKQITTAILPHDRCKP